MNCATVMLTPELLNGGTEQSLFRQMISVVQEYFNNFRMELVTFFRTVFTCMESQSDFDSCLNLSIRLCRLLFVRLQKKPGDISGTSLLCLLAYFDASAQAIIQISTPNGQNAKPGRFFEESLLGHLLSSGALTDPEIANSFFPNPRRLTAGDLNAANTQIWSLTTRATQICFDIFYAILKASEKSRQQLVGWLASVIQANKTGRNASFDEAGIGQLAFFGGQQSDKCSDGFLINLLTVLAKLAKPFAKPWDKRFVDITTEYSGELDLSQETKVVPGGDSSSQSKTMAFREDLFYLIHVCTAASYRRIVERFLHQAQELQRASEMHENVEGGRMQMSPQQFEVLGTRIEMLTKSYLTIRACLFEPNLCQDLVFFFVSTASWLVSKTLGVTASNEITLEKIGSEFRSDEVMKIPELIIENVLEIFLFWKRFHVGINQEILLNLQQNSEHVLSFMLTFIGSRQRLNNPHLRAKLADLLEVFVVPPSSKDSAAGSLSSQGFDLSITSNQHPLASGIIPAVLAVFVSIEMTGQGVNFYEKFNYRRPIYAIIRHCSTLDMHIMQINKLAESAIHEYNEESSGLEPPLFLKFVNLLINDAIYLLDESLGMLVQIREEQDKKNRGELDALSFVQRQQRQQQFEFQVSQCRSLNVLARETIRALTLVTSLVPTFFLHFSLDDRIASMANYFLVHLVGPKQRDLKVENMGDVDFKPDILVRSICSIYVNLGHLEKFRVAVVSDGRSFSPDLFPKASRILTKVRTDMGDIEKFDNVSELIMATTKQVEDDEAIASDAPEEFLDPILGTLMRDPVMLPASKQIVDRSVIIRHLLSDQFDPFNREPLSVDKLIPMTELRDKINKWLEERRVVTSQK